MGSAPVALSVLVSLVLESESTGCIQDILWNIHSSKQSRKDWTSSYKVTSHQALQTAMIEYEKKLLKGQ